MRVSSNPCSKTRIINTYRSTLHQRTDSELFIIDTKGDDKGTLLPSTLLLKLSDFFFPVRRSLPRFSRTALKSHQIISQRSAIPAVHARPRRPLVSSREKERLLRIARKDRRGPLNSIVDPSQPGDGSALLEVTEAVKKSGQYDMWSSQTEAASDVAVKVKVLCPKIGLICVVEFAFAQAPDVPHPRTAITLPAVRAPHSGTSYNPPEAAHTALLRSAHEAELRRIREAETLEATKARILSARVAADEGGMQGMLIDEPRDSPPAEQSQDALQEDDSPGPDSGAAKTISASRRKTKQQRQKAEKLRAEVQHS